MKSCWRDWREGVWLRQATWRRKQDLVSMSCHYESRAAHLKLTRNNLEEVQGEKKKSKQTQKEAIQYTLLFKKAGLSWNCFSAQERSALERHPAYPETPRDIWSNRNSQKSQREAKEGTFGDSMQEKEAATPLNHLRYRRRRRLRWEAQEKQFFRMLSEQPPVSNKTKGTVWHYLTDNPAISFTGNKTWPPLRRQLLKGTRYPRHAGQDKKGHNTHVRRQRSRIQKQIKWETEMDILGLRCRVSSPDWLVLTLMVA